MMAYAVNCVKAPRPDLYYCSVELKLLDNSNSEIKTPYDTLSGVLLIHSDSPKCFLRTLRVQLVGHAITRFQSKIDHKLTKVYLDENFISEEVLENSGLSVYVLGTKSMDKLAGENEQTRFPPGTHTFPFKIHLNGQQFPATFQSAFGQIQYKLVAYAEQGSSKEVVAANKKMFYRKGHFNLTSDPSLSRPVLVTKTKDRSMSFFSKRPLLKLQILLEKCGYVPLEKLNLPLALENPTCERIVRMQVALVQRITYFGAEFLLKKKVSKTTRTVVAEKENFCDCADGHIQWTTALLIPANSMPTFAPDSKCIEIAYSIEFLVAMHGTSQLKGETEIVIGTKARTAALDRGDFEELPDLTENEDRISDLNWDTISIQTCSTLPPGYSTLSSRRPSLETLPPSYFEALQVGNEDFTKEFRARSSSNMI